MITSLSGCMIMIGGSCCSFGHSRSAVLGDCAASCRFLCRSFAFRIAQIHSRRVSRIRSPAITPVQSKIFKQSKNSRSIADEQQCINAQVKIYFAYIRSVFFTSKLGTVEIAANSLVCENCTKEDDLAPERIDHYIRLPCPHIERTVFKTGTGSWRLYRYTCQERWYLPIRLLCEKNTLKKSKSS